MQTTGCCRAMTSQCEEGQHVFMVCVSVCVSVAWGESWRSADPHVWRCRYCYASTTCWVSQSHHLV